MSLQQPEQTTKFYRIKQKLRPYNATLHRVTKMEPSLLECACQRQFKTFFEYVEHLREINPPSRHLNSLINSNLLPAASE